jgi:hypothetical protein
MAAKVIMEMNIAKSCMIIWIQSYFMRSILKA